MKRLFIVNARAGGGRALHSWRTMRVRFEPELRSGVSVEWFPSSSVELLSRLTEFVHFDEWVVVGGDGTLNATINGLLQCRDSRSGTDFSLPLIRVAGAGTGSDYFRSLPEGATVPVDAIRATSDGGEVRYFLNMASVGLSARVAAAKERLPSWVPRSLCYTLPTLSEVWGTRPFQAELRLPGQAPIAGTFWGVFLSKGRYAGGGMRFGAEVQLDDGQLEISCIEDQSPLSILLKMPGLYGTGLHAEPGVRKFRASRVELDFGVPQPLEFDGEPVQATRVMLEILPAERTGLRVGRWRSR